MRIECPRCGNAIPGADVDLGSLLAVCRPCGEVVSLATALTTMASTDAIVPVVPSGLLYRPTDMSWSEEQTGIGAWRVTIVPPRLVAFPLFVFAMAGIATAWSLMCDVFKHADVFNLIFGALFTVAAVFMTRGALCALVNHTTVRIGREGFAVVRGPIRQRGGLREPTANIVGFDVWHAWSQSPRVQLHGPRLWGLHLLTRDGRARPIRLAFKDPSHAKYAAARLTQMLADAQRPERPYRG